MMLTGRVYETYGEAATVAEANGQDDPARFYDAVDGYHGGWHIEVFDENGAYMGIL